MGSGASTSVKSIEINKDDSLAFNTRPKTPLKSEPRRPSTSCSQRSVPPTSSSQRSVPAESEMSAQVTPLQQDFLGQGSMLQATALEKKLAEAESEKLDLQDRVAELEERLLTVQVPPTPTTQAQSLQGNLAKSEMRIIQLEQELTTAQTNANLQVAKLKRKVKRLTAQVTAAKQESSVRHLELDDDLTRLREENEHFKLLQGKHTEGAEAHVDEDDVHDASKMKVILELSSQMSEQSERIAQLEMTLAERDQEIKALRRMHGAGERAHTSLHLPPSGSRPKNPSQPGDKRNNSSLSRDSGLGTRSQGGEGRKKEGRSSHQGSTSSIISGLSDSESEWDPNYSMSKIHSAPPGFRPTTAVSTRNPKLCTTDEDNWSVDGDAATEANYEPKKSKKKSVLKTKQIKERDQRALGLLGPTLAFGGIDSPEMMSPEASSSRCDFDMLHNGPLMAPISTM